MQIFLVGEHAYIWDTHLHLHTKKVIRDELESTLLYDQSYPCSASLASDLMPTLLISEVISFPFR
jgi:hypothetical protein